MSVISARGGFGWDKPKPTPKGDDEPKGISIKNWSEMSKADLKS